MGNLYEDVEKFFGDIFYRVGRFIATYPIVFIVISLITCFLLGLGLINIKYESRVEVLYTPRGSTAFKDLTHLSTLFPDQTSELFYAHHQLHSGTYGEIIVTAKDQKSNVINGPILNEVWTIHEALMAMTLSTDGRGHDYYDLCAARGRQCIIDGELFLRTAKQQTCLNQNTTYPYLISPSGEREDISSVLSGVKVIDNCLTATAFRLRYNLRHDTPAQQTLSIAWEHRFLDMMKNARFHVAQVFHRGSSSIDTVLNEHVSSDTKYFALTIIIMVIYATLVTAGGDCVTTRVMLAQAGVVGVLLAIMASFGLLSMCGIVCVDVCGVVPFLVLGVGADDMFILMAAWRNTDMNAPIIDRLGETFRTGAISVTMTSLTDLLAFCIGATSPFMSVRNFCIYAAFSVLFCYINSLFFFGGFMVLQARRIEAGRHCVTCLPARTKTELQEEGQHKMYILACAGQQDHKPGENDSMCEKLFRLWRPKGKRYFKNPAKLLLQDTTKLVVVLVFVAYLVISFWGASQLQTGLKLESIVPEESYLAKFLSAEERLYAHDGPYVMFVIEDPYYPINYFDKSKQEEVTYLLGNVSRSGYVDPLSEINWISAYQGYIQANATLDVHQGNFLTVLRQNFLEDNPKYKDDILFNEETNAILASRVYIEALYYKDATSDGAMMTVMRSLAANSSLTVTAYSPMFLFCEHYVTIMKNTLLAVGVAILGMLFVALAFIPHVISIVMVIATMLTIVIGMFAFMHFWGLALSAITSVQIILAVGFCVDFTMHICHAFMCASGMNRNDRMLTALEFVGVPVLNGAMSSTMGILMLAFADSFVFRSFFKTMLLVIILGLGHALLLLPVALSVIGPSRTSAPRVFIAISPAARAGETFRPKFKRQHSGGTCLSDDTGTGKEFGYTPRHSRNMAEVTEELMRSTASIATDERCKLLPSHQTTLDVTTSSLDLHHSPDDHGSQSSRALHQTPHHSFESERALHHTPHQSFESESVKSYSNDSTLDRNVVSRQMALERMESMDSDLDPHPPLITVSRDDILVEVSDGEKPSTSSKSSEHESVASEASSTSNKPEHAP